MTIPNLRPRVLVCDPIADNGLALLAQHTDVDVRTNLKPEELLAIIDQYQGVVVRSATTMTAEIIERGHNLKVIGRAGAGLDNIDVRKAQDKQIAVVNAPDANTVAVAEHTMGLLLALARRLPRADESLKAGKWEKQSFMGTGLVGKTLGLVGFGRIGRQVAIRAQAFGMKILVNQLRPTPELNLAEARNVDLHELLRLSDFVSLHVPMRADTQGIVGRAELALMKPTAYIINTARGGVVDEDALLEALSDGRLAGAALDVFVTEPATNTALIQHEKVIATPHIAASTEDAQRVASLAVAEQIVEILRDVEVENILPLRVVPMDKIFPHESIDPKRVDKLAARLDAEGLLRNPTVVMQVEDKYMVLDGATRTAAFKKLGYSHTVVQICSPETGLGLHTWYHVAQKIEVESLLDLLRAIPNIALVPSTAEKADDDMFAYGSLCYLHTADGRVFLVQTAAGLNRLDALNQLTETYIAACTVDRTLEKDLITLKNDYPNLAALIVFPEYTVSQVMQVTLSGRYFPAGITRFLIPGRILRLNADLAILKSAEMSLADKSKWLYDFLEEKTKRNAIRYYGEPVYLLDE